MIANINKNSVAIIYKVNTSSFDQNLDSNSFLPLILFLNDRRKDELKLTLIINLELVVVIHQY